MRLSQKIWLTVFATLAVSMLFWFIRYYSTEQILTSNQIIEKFNQLNLLSTELKQENDTLRLSTYPNYDPLNQKIAQWQQALETLQNHKELQQPNHNQSHAQLKRLEGAFQKNLSLLLQFQSLHSTLRNSTLYIPSLSRLIASNPKHRPLFPRLSAISEHTSLAMSLNRISELVQLSQEAAQVRQLAEGRGFETRLIDSYLAHLGIFIAQFPLYMQVNSQIEQAEAQMATEFNQALAQFRQEDQRSRALIKELSIVLYLLLLFAEVIIVFLIIKSDKASLTDKLTGYGNRLAFHQEIERLVQPELLLVNLDGFKQINNFYGITGGDFVLKGWAKRLSKQFQGEAKVFRVSGDEFGLLFENAGLARLVEASELIEEMGASPFVYQSLPINIQPSQVLVDQRPLLTKANMVMSYLKGIQDQRVMAYSEHLGLEEQVAKNFETLEKLKKAILEDRIQPVFQPIIDTKTLKTTKFECLIRLKEENGKLLSPYFFLDVAKQAGLYRGLTLIMVEKCFDRFLHSSYGFSLNLSAQDITDSQLSADLLARLKANPEQAKRTTFEILESEGIENFELVERFIAKAKALGATIAIDDFGAGYSNFENILKLNVDILKVDGSLIKRIDEDKAAQQITRSILWFAREIGLKTVVEFVHSQPVMDVVVELGADLLQGFHLGAPEPDFEEPDS